MEIKSKTTLLLKNLSNTPDKDIEKYTQSVDIGGNARENIIVGGKGNIVIVNTQIRQSVDIDEHLDLEIGKKLGYKKNQVDSFDIITEPMYIEGVTNRAVSNIDILDRFLFATKKLSKKPIIRLYGNYTAISTNRFSSSDYDQLIKTETKYIEKFIKHGYEVRVLASLDVPYILSTWTSKNKFIDRVAGMVRQIQKLEDKYDNLIIEIDSFNRMEGCFILGGGLMIKSLKPVVEHGYSLTFFDNDSARIGNAIKTFDNSLRENISISNTIKSHLRIDKISNYVQTIGNGRLKEI